MAWSSRLTGRWVVGRFVGPLPHRPSRAVQPPAPTAAAAALQQPLFFRLFQCFNLLLRFLFWRKQESNNEDEGIKMEIKWRESPPGLLHVFKSQLLLLRLLLFTSAVGSSSGNIVKLIVRRRGAVSLLLLLFLPLLCLVATYCSSTHTQLRQ